MPTLEEIENYLENKIFSDLDKGRPDWDVPHTRAAVENLKEILNNYKDKELDELVLLLATYAHDWGYSDLFEQKNLVTHQKVENKKVEHMKMGAEKMADLLSKKFFDFLTKEQKNRVVHLVGVHDYLDRLKDKDELILMEADTLGQLDIERVKSTFGKADGSKWLEDVLKKRYPKFITEYGKHKFNRLYKLQKKYFKSLPE